MRTATAPDPHAALATAHEELADLEGDLPTLQALVGDRELAINCARKDGVIDLANLTTLETNASAARSLLTRHEQGIAELQVRVLELEAGGLRADLGATINTAAITYKAARDAYAKAVDALAASVAKYASEADERLHEALTVAAEAYDAATTWTDQHLGPGKHDPQTVRRTYAGALKAGGLDVSSLEHQHRAEEIYRHATQALALAVPLIRTAAGKGERWP